MNKLMKTSVLVLGIVLPCFLVAQNDLDVTDSEVKEKKFRVDLSYTLAPSNLFQTSMTINNVNNDAFYLKQKSSFGPLGARFEYLFRENWSVGVDLYYNQQRSEGTVTFAVNGQQAQADYVVNRLRVQTRFAYQFPINNPDLDVYIGGGIGSNTKYRNLYIDGERRSKSDLPLAISLPFSVRAFSGIRYTFFHDLGFHAEIGIGGPVLTAGLSYKF